MAEAAAKPVPAKELSLHPQRFTIAEQARTCYQAVVESDVKREDLLDPAFFAHIASRLIPGDRIEVRWDDESQLCELYVLACDRTWTQMRVLNYWSFESDAVEVAQSRMQSIGYEVMHKGAHRKWAIIRTADKAIVKEGCQTKAEAMAWLGNYIKTVNETIKAA